MSNMDNNFEEDLGPLDDCELLREIAMALVTHPEAIRVEEEIDGACSTFTIFADPSDRGQLIGKQGETVSAIRKLFVKIAAGQSRKAFIVVDEPNKPANVDTYRRRSSAA